MNVASYSLIISLTEKYSLGDELWSLLCKSANSLAGGTDAVGVGGGSSSASLISLGAVAEQCVSVIGVGDWSGERARGEWLGVRLTQAR